MNKAVDWHHGHKVKSAFKNRIFSRLLFLLLFFIFILLEDWGEELAFFIIFFKYATPSIAVLKLEELPINMSHQTTPPTRIKRQQDIALIYFHLEISTGKVTESDKIFRLALFPKDNYCNYFVPLLICLRKHVRWLDKGQIQKYVRKCKLNYFTLHLAMSKHPLKNLAGTVSKATKPSICSV